MYGPPVIVPLSRTTSVCDSHSVEQPGELYCTIPPPGGNSQVVRLNNALYTTVNGLVTVLVVYP